MSKENLLPGENCPTCERPELTSRRAGGRTISICGNGHGWNKEEEREKAQVRRAAQSNEDFIMGRDLQGEVKPLGWTPNGRSFPYPDAGVPKSEAPLVTILLELLGWSESQCGRDNGPVLHTHPSTDVSALEKIGVSICPCGQARPGEVLLINYYQCYQDYALRDDGLGEFFVPDERTRSISFDAGFINALAGMHDEAGVRSRLTQALSMEGGVNYVRCT